MATIPSLEKVGAAWKEAEAEEAFWQKHYPEYLEKYPDQFVAVYRGRVVAASSDLEQLIHILAGKGFDMKKVRVRFITADPRRVLL